MIRAATEAGRRIRVSGGHVPNLHGGCGVTLMPVRMHHSGESGGPFLPALRRRLRCWSTTLLVTKGGAFYNPSNTALETVVWFIRNHGAQPPNKSVVHSVSEC